MENQDTTLLKIGLVRWDPLILLINVICLLIGLSTPLLIFYIQNKRFFFFLKPDLMRGGARALSYIIYSEAEGKGMSLCVIIVNTSSNKAEWRS